MTRTGQGTENGRGGGDVRWWVTPSPMESVVTLGIAVFGLVDSGVRLAWGLPSQLVAEVSVRSAETDTACDELRELNVEAGTLFGHSLMLLVMSLGQLGLSMRVGIGRMVRNAKRSATGGEEKSHE